MVMAMRLKNSIQNFFINFAALSLNLCNNNYQTSFFIVLTFARDLANVSAIHEKRLIPIQLSSNSTMSHYYLSNAGISHNAAKPYDEWIHIQGKQFCHFHFCLPSQCG